MGLLDKYFGKKKVKTEMEEIKPDPNLEKIRSDPNLNLTAISGELELLPQWAVVAFGVRCMRRIQPLLKGPKQYLDIIDKAIAVADRAANIASYDAIEVKRTVKSTQEVTGISLNTPVSSNDNDEKKATISGAKAAISIAEVIYMTSSETRSITIGMVLSYSSAACGFILGNIPEIIVLRERWDFLQLKKTSEIDGWTDSTPVPQDVFGQLWPNGLPKGWPNS